MISEMSDKFWTPYFSRRPIIQKQIHAFISKAKL